VTVWEDESYQFSAQGLKIDQVLALRAIHLCGSVDDIVV
jgi:hypothetical protein